MNIHGYRIEREIGSGGMATVYLAVQESLERPVALKVIHRHLSKNESFRKRFFNEARLMARLSHPSIVQAYDFAETDQGLFIVMQYVQGQSLDHMIGAECGPIPHEKALPLFLQILEGVAYAHSMGVIHRDIKPSNVLVSKEGKAKILDLGIAKIAGQKGLTRTGAQMGTLYYESPEQIRGAKDVDHRADIYSLGMTLYEMLAGRLPFDGEDDTSEFEVMNSIVNRQQHLDPREHYPHIPEWLVKVTQKATELDRLQRFSDCGQFKRVIEAIWKAPGEGGDYWAQLADSAAPERDTAGGPTIDEGLENVDSEVNLCPGCGAETAPGASFCGKCGTRLESACPACGRAVVAGDSFCPGCGASLEGGSGHYNGPEATVSAGAGDTPPHSAVSMSPGEEREIEHFISQLMEFAVVPGGSFLMGSPKPLLGKGGPEQPNHIVQVHHFQISKTPVTQKGWSMLMKSDPSSFPGDDRPVENVSWEDCREFCRRLSTIDTRYTYRLPSEAEWEYACRAGQSARYFWGKDDSPRVIQLYCWLMRNSQGSTQPVATKLPNRWDLYDMLGNIWEWCQDVYHPNYGGAPSTGDPWLSGDSGARVIRGGSWSTTRNACYCACRLPLGANESDSSTGFRVVRE